MAHQVMAITYKMLSKIHTNPVKLFPVRIMINP